MKLPVGYVPGVGLLTNTALGGFGQRMLERMGWRKGDGLGKDGKGVKEAVEAKAKQDTAGIGAKKGGSWAHNTWESAYKKALAALPQGSDSGKSEAGSSDNEAEGGRESFRTADGNFNVDGTRTTASAHELKIYKDLSKGGTGHWGARGGKLARIRRQEGLGNSPAAEAAMATEEKHTCAGTASKDAQLSTPDAFGTPLVDEAAGFGSPIWMSSSASPSLGSGKVEPKSKGKKAKKVKKKGTLKKRKAAKEAAAYQNVDSGSDIPTTAKRSSARKRKPRVYLAEENDDHNELPAKKEGESSKAKKKNRSKKNAKGLKRVRSLVSKRASVVKVVASGKAGHEEKAEFDVAVQPVGKRAREGAATSSAQQRGRLKSDKKGKSKKGGNRKRANRGDQQGEKRKKLRLEAH